MANSFNTTNQSPQQDRENLNIPQLIGLLADSLAIFFAFFFIKSQIDDSIQTLKFPLELNFYFLFFWAFVSAIIGGFAWNLFSRLTKTNVILTEPHKLNSLLWALVSNLPTVLTLILLNILYPFVSQRHQVLYYGAFLIGNSIGAMIYYDVPIKGYMGFRGFVSKGTQRTTPLQEFWLSLIWTGLLSIGFIFMNIARFLSVPSTTLLNAILSFFLQIGLFVSMTTMAITFGLIAFPRKERTETALGIIAGLFIKVALFFSLLLAN